MSHFWQNSVLKIEEEEEEEEGEQKEEAATSTMVDQAVRSETKSRRWVHP